MRFKIAAADLLATLDVVSNVTPCPINQQGAAGYLFRAYTDKDGNPRCRIYSRDRHEVVSGDMKLLELEGEGAFIAPTAPVNFLEGIKYLPEDMIEFESKSQNTPQGEAFVVSFKASSGAFRECPSISPTNVTPLDRDFEKAPPGQTFPAAILREALSTAKRFMADPKESRAEEYLKTMEIFDGTDPATAKGNGTLFATNNTKAFYFQCEAFVDHALAVHASHADRLISFLSKCSGDIEFRRGEHMMFAINKVDSKEGVEGERIFGWAFHTKKHTRYSYYARKNEKWIFLIAKMPLLNALRYAKTGLEPNRDKIQIKFSAKDSHLTFHVVDSTSKDGSFPLPVTWKLSDEIDEAYKDKDFEYNLNIEQLMELVDGVKGNTVEFRVGPLQKDEKKPRGSAMFRTIDEFWLDAKGNIIGGSGAEKDEAGNEKRPEGGIKCRVTRYMPSKD